MQAVHGVGAGGGTVHEVLYTDGVMVILLLVPKMVFFLATAITRVITGRLAGEKALMDI